MKKISRRFVTHRHRRKLFTSFPIISCVEWIFSRSFYSLSLLLSRRTPPPPQPSLPLPPRIPYSKIFPRSRAASFSRIRRTVYYIRQRLNPNKSPILDTTGNSSIPNIITFSRVVCVCVHVCEYCPFRSSNARRIAAHL